MENSRYNEVINSSSKYFKKDEIKLHFQRLLSPSKSIIKKENIIFNTKENKKKSNNNNNNLGYKTPKNYFLKKNISVNELINNENTFSSRFKKSKKKLNNSLLYSLKISKLNSYIEENEKKENNYNYNYNDFIKIINDMSNLFNNNQFENYLLNKSNNNDNLFNDYIKNIYDIISYLKKENEKIFKIENSKSKIFNNNENENIILKESNERKKIYNKCFTLIFNSLNDLTNKNNNSKINKSNKINQEENKENYTTEENFKLFNVNFNLNVNNNILDNTKNEILDNISEKSNNQKINEENNTIGQTNRYQFKVQKQFNGEKYTKTLYLLTPDVLRKSLDNFSLARNTILNYKYKKNLQNVKTEFNLYNEGKNKKNSITPQQSIIMTKKNLIKQDFICRFKRNDKK